MQKRNKIMMATVAILLSLVLITTSIVSSTFAKYVAQKRVDGSFDIDAFGVTVGMELSDEFKAAINSDYAGQTDDKTITLTLNNLKLKPGDSYLDAVKFTVNGTPSVDVQLRLDMDVSYDIADFTIYKTDFPNVNFPTSNGVEQTSLVSMPISFCTGSIDATGNYKRTYANYPYGSYGAGAIYRNTCNELWELIDFEMGYILNDDDSAVLDMWLYKEFAAGSSVVFHPSVFDSKFNRVGADDSINVNDFDFGFYWPGEYGNNETEITYYDAVGTWIVEHYDPTITITYTVTVEQIILETES